jgi:hypothetical protein
MDIFDVLTVVTKKKKASMHAGLNENDALSLRALQLMMAQLQ